MEGPCSNSLALSRTSSIGHSTRNMVHGWRDFLPGVVTTAASRFFPNSGAVSHWSGSSYCPGSVPSLGKLGAVSYRGWLAVSAIVTLSAGPLVALWVLYRTSARHPTFGGNLVFHLGVLAWLITISFPDIGELP